MEMKNMFEKNSGQIANLLLDTLVQHTLCTIKQVMMFANNETQDKMVDTITDFRDGIREATIKEPEDDPSEVKT